MVGLEETLYQVSEDVGVVEVCAIVHRPDGNILCAISYVFNVILSTSDDSAGDEHIYTLNHYAKFSLFILSQSL